MTRNPNDPLDDAAAEQAARDAFLWDPKAPAVDDVVALQRALAPLSASRNAAEPPAIVRKPRARQLTIGATVSALALAASIALVVKVRAPDDVIVIDGGARRSVAVGERIDTTDRPATVELGAHGVVTLAPGSQLSVVNNTRKAQELALERGSLSAVVVAPPRFFTVRTKAARAVDMGCAYELSVDDEGTTTLVVTSGYVALEDVDDVDESAGAASVDVLVPAGASARAKPNARPTLPFRADATAALRTVVDAPVLDVDALLATADARDAITLWYALRRVNDVDRARVLERLLAVSPPPTNVDVAALRSGDVDALQAWLDAIEQTLTPWPTHAFP